MSSLVSACKKLGLLAWVGVLPLAALGQARFDLQGSEYRIIGGQQGDQVFPQVALNQFGGYLVWQDNATDGDGSGISARAINRSLSGALGSFRVNEAGAGDQAQPQVALLSNGGAAFVWQSSVGSTVKVYARFLAPDGTFATGDVAVSSAAGEQTLPVIASLSGGNVVVVWSSMGQERTTTGQPIANGMQGVFAQLFSQAGAKIGGEFQVNSSSLLNQRNPALAPLSNGGFVVAWISESLRSVDFGVDATGRTEVGAGVDNFDVTVNGQLYDGEGQRVGNELRLSSNLLLCANPSVLGTEEGFTLAWSAKINHPNDEAERKDGWDVFARLFALDGSAKQAEFRVNSFVYGDQFQPKLGYQDGINFVLWTSMGQDGSFEGVVARLLSASGQLMSKEFRVNTTTVGKQFAPAIAANGTHTFLTIWSGFIGGLNSFDLFAQRYSSSAEPGLAPPAAPYVSAISQTKLNVTWPELSGFSGVKYEVYVDDGTSPVLVENNSAVIVALQPETTHTFRLAYALPDGEAISVIGSGHRKNVVGRLQF